MKAKQHQEGHALHTNMVMQQTTSSVLSFNRLKVLRLLLCISEASAPYNQFSLPLSEEQSVTICSFFESDMSVPEQITLFEGDGSLQGFLRALKAALDGREYDIIHGHTPHVGVLFLVANLFYDKLKSSVYTVHNAYHNFKPRNRLLLVPVFAFFRRVVFCSHTAFESFPAFYKWLGGDRMRVVQNSLDIDRVDCVVANKKGCCQRDNFTIAAVGQLIERKNPVAVLRAFQQSDDRRSNLVFIGEGHLRGLLTRKIEESGLSNRVEFTGLIPRDQVYERLAQADLFASASTGEGLPVAVLEAMACRCPVVLSDIPPHREIAGGVSFIPLIYSDDSAGFAREIQRFRQMSPLQRAEIGDKCRKLVEARFSLSVMLRRYEEIYSEVRAAG